MEGWSQPQGEQAHYSETLNALERLFLDICSGDVKPEGHETKMKKVLALPMQKETMSDDETLKELDKLAATEAKVKRGETKEDA